MIIFIEHLNYTNAKENNYIMDILLLFENASKSEKLSLMPCDKMKHLLHICNILLHYLKITILNGVFLEEYAC